MYRKELQVTEGADEELRELTVAAPARWLEPGHTVAFNECCVPTQPQYNGIERRVQHQT